MTLTTWMFAILFYIAFTVFFIGLGYRIYLFATSPAPLKIPTTPAPVTQTGVVLRMFREVVFFESLFKATKWTWIFSWAFHIGLALVTIRHLRYFMDPVWAPVVWLQPFGIYAGFLMVFGLVGLLGRRIFVDRVRYISSPSDYLMLLLIILIGLTGLMMKFVAHTDIVAIKSFFQGMLTLSPSALPGDFLPLLHLFLVAMLAIIFPFSKLLHAPGIFFSPTRNQVDNPREQRHIAPWARKLEE